MLLYKLSTKFPTKFSPNGYAFASFCPFDTHSESYVKRTKKERNRVSQKKPSFSEETRFLDVGPYYPLDADYGARVACFAIISAGLRDGARLMRAANHLRHADPNEAAWWLGLLTRDDNSRALRALRILTEAVK
jgi:hypothetical protein